MKFITDFHIHSHYSRATSPKLIPEYLEFWAKLKGIDVVGTGDCVHPGWLKELKEKLEPVGNGLYQLKDEFRGKIPEHLPDSLRDRNVFFILTTEISSIYKKNNKVRKVHNVCVLPDFKAADTLYTKLDKIGNLNADGRPILGLDAKTLLAITLEVSDRAYMIPAHIWTPWFSVLGSKSGFDSLEECFEDLTPFIFAVETGLSSDPPMNRLCRFLDRFRLVSNSDAHSPEKLGREANLFDAELSYDGIYQALKKDQGFLGTIEFFPQEGKYFYDGHRKCQICWNPLQTIQHKGLCSKCGRPVTKGVMYRVAELADRPAHEPSGHKQQFYSITPLPELVAEIVGVKSTSSKTVSKIYFDILGQLGAEFPILLWTDIAGIKAAGHALLAKGIERLRKGEIHIKTGYDGEFGRITVFNKDELDSLKQGNLFATSGGDVIEPKARSVEFSVEEFQKFYQNTLIEDQKTEQVSNEQTHEQKHGIEHGEGVCLVLAGPGSGKTYMLTQRIIRLIIQKKIPQERILAVTFSNKAAHEIKKRIEQKINPSKVQVCTFHALGLLILKENFSFFSRKQGFSIIDADDKIDILKALLDCGQRSCKTVTAKIEAYKQGRLSEDGYKDISSVLERYEAQLRQMNAFDLDDLIHLPVMLLKEHKEILKTFQSCFPWILVDEYQDINARQYELVRLLAGEGKPNLFVIGDPDQAIYGFRGADICFIDKLKSDYPDMTTICLKKSYRCPENVLKIAGQALDKNEFLQGRPDDIKIGIHTCPTAKSESDYIASKIEVLMGGVRSFSMDSGISDGQAAQGIESFSDIAVLCRTTSLFEPFIQAFNNHGIAYQVVGSAPFYTKKPFAPLIKKARNIFYPRDPEESDVGRQIHEKFQEGVCLTDILGLLSKDAKLNIQEQRALERLAGPYGVDYEHFFQDLILRQGSDDFDTRAEAVSLMTIHAAKGLEFKAVFIPACEKRVIPWELFGPASPAELAEEERLFYVAVTRTQKYLFITHSKKRIMYGRLMEQQRSPLLDRLEKGLLSLGQRKIEKTNKEADSGQMSLF